jgi:hypothetical protein
MMQSHYRDQIRFAGQTEAIDLIAKRFHERHPYNGTGGFLRGDLRLGLTLLSPGKLIGETYANVTLSAIHPAQPQLFPAQPARAEFRVRYAHGQNEPLRGNAHENTGVFANLFFGKVLGYTPWTTGNDQNAFCVYPPESARDGGHVVHTSIVTVRLNDLFDKLNIDPRKYRLRVKIAEAKKAAELGFTLDPAGEAHVLTGLARMPRSKILARTFSKLAQRTGEHIRNLVGRDNSARPAKARPFNRRRQPTF